MRILLVALLLTAAAGAGLYGYSHYQGLERTRQEALGRQCSERLAALREAAERYALASQAGAEAAWPQGGPAAALAPYLVGLDPAAGCPAGGDYRFPPTVTDKDGRILPPACPHESETIGKSELPNGRRGLHVLPP
ncbi:hypothetical protein HS125_19420 [bacterium]|nr:hypothetical protein [bacterium]